MEPRHESYTLHQEKITAIYCKNFLENIKRYSESKRPLEAEHKMGFIFPERISEEFDALIRFLYLRFSSQDEIEKINNELNEFIDEVEKNKKIDGLNLAIMRALLVEHSENENQRKALYYFLDESKNKNVKAMEFHTMIKKIFKQPSLISNENRYKVFTNIAMRFEEIIKKNNITEDVIFLIVKDIFLLMNTTCKTIWQNEAVAAKEKTIVDFLVIKLNVYLEKADSQTKISYQYFKIAIKRSSLHRENSNLTMFPVKDEDPAKSLKALPRVCSN